MTTLSGELERAYARPDIAQIKADVAQWLRYYRHAFEDGVRIKPKENISAEFEPPEMDFLGLRSAEVHDRILATMMVVLADVEDEAFIGYWAWGAFWAMLPDIDDPMLRRIEDEARRTPRFRWMLSLLRLPSAPPAIRASLEALASSVDLSRPMPPAPWV